MRKSLLLIACLVLPAFCLHSAEPNKDAPNWVDPVVLENAYLKAVVDRGRGATLRSLLIKPEGRETAREFLTSHGWCGALAEDRLAGDGYPGEITRLHYTGSAVRSDSAQTLRLHCLPESEKYRGLEFIKTFTLLDNAAYIMVDWEIVNRLDNTQAVTPWVHNIVGSQFRNTLLPKPDGIALIPPSADYFHDPVRNWLGGYNPETGQLVYFCADFSQMLKQYYCYWNGYHTLEWTYQPAPLETGESWSSWYAIGVTRSVAAAASIIPEASLSYTWTDEGLKIDVTWNCALGQLQIQPTLHGKETKRLPILETTSKVSKISSFTIPLAEIPADKQSLRLTLYQDGKELQRRQFKETGNYLEIDLDPVNKVSADKLPPQSWPAPKSPYLNIQPRQLPARPYEGQNVLQLWEVSHLEKIFEQDSFVADNSRRFDPPALRNSRFFRQFVLHNAGKEALSVQVDADSLLLHNGQESLPVTLRLVGYVATTEPSGFTMKWPVGRYPDPLLPMPEKFAIEPGQSQPLWLEGEIPARQSLGLYQGNLRLQCTSGQMLLPVNCQVIELTLPELSSLRSTVGCWSLSANLLKEVGYEGSPAQFHKLCQDLYFQQRLTPRENGLRWTFDAKMDEKLRELRQRNINSIIIPSNISRKEELLDKAVASLKSHGLFEMAFCYMQDEAPADRFPEVIADCRRLHARHPDLKLLGTIYEKDVSALYGHIQIWCRNISSDPWQIERKKAGDEFMSSNLPGLALEDVGYAPVIPFLQLHYHRYSGFLFWNMIGGYGRDNPWKNILCAGSNGNAHLLYPHASGPLETMRWENIYYGVELFELLSMLEKQKPEKYALLRPRLENPSSADELQNVRAEVLQALLAP